MLLLLLLLRVLLHGGGGVSGAEASSAAGWPSASGLLRRIPEEPPPSSPFPGASSRNGRGELVRGLAPGCQGRCLGWGWQERVWPAELPGRSPPWLSAGGGHTWVATVTWAVGQGRGPPFFPSQVPQAQQVQVAGCPLVGVCEGLQRLPVLPVCSWEEGEC